MSDPLTRSAIAIVARAATASNDRRVRRAVDHLRRELGDQTDVARTSKCLIVQKARASDPHDAAMTDDSARPSPRELEIFVRAVMAACAHGLRLPPDACRFVWFDRDGPDQAEGFVDLAANPMCVWLARGLSDRELYATVLHELRHVGDRLILGAQFFALADQERERRARAFEQHVMAAEGLSRAL